MSIIVNLPAELEKTIAAEAAKAGMTVSDYVAGRLAAGRRAAGRLDQGTTTNGSRGSKRRLTGPEMVHRWKELGLIGYRTDITDPEAHSRRLREAAQRRTAG
jgi:hypothetical protein